MQQTSLTGVSPLASRLYHEFKLHQNMSPGTSTASRGEPNLTHVQRVMPLDRPLHMPEPGIPLLASMSTA
eukprot:473901-Amphidinium_carterae.1